MGQLVDPSPLIVNARYDAAGDKIRNTHDKIDGKMWAKFPAFKNKPGQKKSWLRNANRCEEDDHIAVFLKKLLYT